MEADPSRLWKTYSRRNLLKCSQKSFYTCLSGSVISLVFFFCFIAALGKNIRGACFPEAKHFPWQLLLLTKEKTTLVNPN